VAALGYTLQLPTEDRFIMTESELKNRLAVLLGGRVAEELMYQEVSTGARDDLMKATEIAKSMVKIYGMSEKVGQFSFDQERQPLFLQAGITHPGGDYSETTAREIDCEVRRIIEEQYGRVRALLTAQEESLRAAAQALLNKEIISGDELRSIVSEIERQQAAARTQDLTVH
jgi:cell division protease FtsH